MSSQLESTAALPEQYALVIGIDAYDQGDGKRYNTKGGLIEYDNLSGCVEDALELEQYLLGPLGVKDSHITKLLSPLPCVKADLEQQTSFDAPTYNNIVKEITAFTAPELTKAGDKILIHYSGHGARATTIFPGLKDDDDLDEALVPCDIINGGNYLRDLEFALLLRRMVDKGLVVTVVLDCCHSGSATRAGRERRFRRIVDLHKSDLEIDRPPSYDDIVKMFPSKSAKHAVSKRLKSTDTGYWLQEPHGYALFAACCKNELASEYEPEEDGRPRGALTYWLLNTLRHCAGMSVSSDMLYRRICAKIKDEAIDQTPILAGDIHRLFFDRGDVLPARSVIINSVEDDTVELGQGRLHGVCVGSTFSIFPFTAAIQDTQALGKPLAMATVTSVKSLAASATVTFDDIGETRAMIESGCQAALTGLPVEEKVHFSFSSSDPKLDEGFAATWEAHSTLHPWLHLLPQNDIKSKFVITRNDNNEFEIQGRYGNVKHKNLAILPPVLVGDGLQHAVPKLARRMRHLAHFDRVQELENPDETCVLRNGFNFELLGRCYSPFPSDTTFNVLQEKAGGFFEVLDGDLIVVRVQNTFHAPINFTILSLQPLFGVEQAYPDSNFETLDPREEKKIKFQMELPWKLKPTASSVPAIDILKIFVTLEAFSVSPILLNEIHIGENRGSKVGNPLKTLLDKWGRVRLRNVNRVVENWQTLSIRIRTLPRSP